MPSTRSEEDNFNCFLKIMNVAVCEGLREIFKQEWDKHYGATKRVWDDTCISCNELYNMERTRPHAKPYLNSYQSGKRSEWDCSALSDAILYSNALKMHLASHVSNKVDELRVLRNNLTHKFGSQHKMPDAAFNNAYQKVKNCLIVLKLSTADLERIRNSSKRNQVIHLTKKRYICLAIFIGALYCWFSNAFVARSLFRVLPTRPVHLVANRTRTVNAIVEELQILSIRNNRALAYLYISGNPGSGKSQLARLVGKGYDTSISYGWFGSTTFVMTLNGRSIHDILESYVEFARRVDCNENNIANIRNSNQSTIVTKINNLRTEIAKSLSTFNVVNLSEISSFLPQLEDEDWQGGQVLITTQDISSVPPNSSLTVHISVSQGMNPAESSEFLTDLSEVFENQDLVSKVAKELDYQPLALASAAFYVKQLRESKASPQFTWRDYLKKLSDGKRNLTEMKLGEVNEPAYSLTMSTAVLLAVKTFAESDSVLKHAFTFLSYVSHEAQSLEVIVSYILRVDKEKDKEDVGLRIRQCSLIMASDDQKVVSIFLHRVVHDSIKLYIANDTEQNTKSRVPFYVFQLLLLPKCRALGEIALIPHLKAFCARIKSLPSEMFVPGSMKRKQKILEQIFNLTTVLIDYGEFLLSENFLFLALKIAMSGRDKDKLDHKGISYTSFPKIGFIYSYLGIVESHFGKLAKSKEYHERALEIFLKQHGDKHETVARTYMNIASLGCSNVIECSEIVRYSKLALEIDGRPDIRLFYYMNLGTYHYVKGNLRKAKKYYLRAVDTIWKTEERNGTRSVRVITNVAASFGNLGYIEWNLGKHKESKKYLRLSIDSYLAGEGHNHLGLANSYYTLGVVYFELNELPDAEDCFRRAREIYSQQFEPSHEMISMVSKHLVDVLTKTGQLREAADLGKRYGTSSRNGHL